MLKSNFDYYNETDTTQNVARLEYYDNEKKFRSGFNAKRAIKLKNCFNINRRLDTKFDFVIALSTKDGALGIIVESEDEMNKWLSTLLSLQRKDINGWDLPNFDHVWQVNIQKKSLAEHKWLFGNYHVCLANKSITFVKITADKNIPTDQRLPTAEVLLTTIRRCGDSQCIFYMEIGRQSILGPGEIWMETEDSTIAQHMHRMILSKMTSTNEGQTEPMRRRSSSATEASKPFNERRGINNTATNNSLPNTATFIRERCDSLPSRNRSSSECSSSHNFRNNSSVTAYRSHMNPRLSISPPIMCSESEESSISIDEPDESFIFMPYRLSTRASDEVIPEESAEEPSYSDSNIKQQDIKTGNTRNGKIEKGKYSSKLGGNSSSQTETINDVYSKGLSESKESFLEMELSGMRPARAYSVGNKVQHSYVQTLKEKHSNENSSNRVRAFSVGSKTKMPKCDAIRTHNKLNLNNNNNSNTNNGTNILDIISNKKSTSAPLLNKYQNASAEQMSDLMEIDFTKHMDRKYYNNCRVSSKEMKATNDIKLAIDNYREMTQKDSTFVGVAPTDNGYLEMKPIAIKSTTKNGLISNSGTPTTITALTTSTYTNTSNMNYCNHFNVNAVRPEALNKMKDEVSNNINSNEGCKKDVKKSPDKHLIIASTLSNSDDAVNEKSPILYYCINEKSFTTDEANGKCKEKRDTLIENITNKLITLKNESECFVPQSNDTFNNFINKQLTPPIECTDVELPTITTTLATATTTTAMTTSATMTMTTLDASKLKRNSLSTIKATASQIPLPIHTLYYASLDLPICGNKVPQSINPASVASDASPLMIVKNSYAKIDFDHHD